MNWGAAATRGGSPQLAEKGKISDRFPSPRTTRIRALGGAARNRICVLGFAESPIHYQKSENLETGFASFRNPKKRLLEPSKSDSFRCLWAGIRGRDLGWGGMGNERRIA